MFLRRVPVDLAGVMDIPYGQIIEKVRADQENERRKAEEEERRRAEKLQAQIELQKQRMLEQKKKMLDRQRAAVSKAAAKQQTDNSKSENVSTMRHSALPQS